MVEFEKKGHQTSAGRHSDLCRTLLGPCHVRKPSSIQAFLGDPLSFSSFIHQLLGEHIRTPLLLRTPPIVAAKNMKLGSKIQSLSTVRWCLVTQIPFFVFSCYAQPLADCFKQKHACIDRGAVGWVVLRVNTSQGKNFRKFLRMVYIHGDQ